MPGRRGALPRFPLRTDCDAPPRAALPPRPSPAPQGEHAHRIWDAIYDTINCAREAAGECAESRVFYRLVSGMHSSISTHLTAYWLLDEERGVWGPNMEEFE